MAGEVKFSIRDQSDETSTTGLQTRQATNANFDTIVLECDALQTALDSLTLGVISRRRFTAQVNDISGALPASPWAQRELKWLVEMVDTVGERATMEIPAADLSDGSILVSGTDQADMSHAAWVAFKAAVDGIFEHRATGNTLTVISARLVGRNL